MKPVRKISLFISISLLFLFEASAQSYFNPVYLTGYSFGETEYGTPCIVRDEETKEQEINLFNEIELNVTDEQLSKCNENLAYSDDRIQISTYYMSVSRTYDSPTQYDPFFIVKTKANNNSENKRIFLNKMKDHGGIKEIKKVYEADNGTIYISVIYVVTHYDGPVNWESIFSIDKNNKLSYLMDFRTEFSNNDTGLDCNYGFLESKNKVLFWVADNYHSWPSGKVTTSIYDFTKETIQLKHNEYSYTDTMWTYESDIAYLPEGCKLYNDGQLVYKAKEDTIVSLHRAPSYEGTDENGIWNQELSFYDPDDYSEKLITGRFQLDKIKFVYEIVKTESLTKGKN